MERETLDTKREVRDDPSGSTNERTCVPLQPEKPAPYTTASAAVTIMEAFRERGLPGPINGDVLIKVGVPESLVRRTLQSLRDLELIGKNGNPTEVWTALRQTRGDEEYRARLQAWLRDVYQDILTYGDPSRDSLSQIQEAFRTYQPAGQRKAMAALLVGLWRYAGLPLLASENGTSARGPVQRPRRPQTRQPRQRQGTQVKSDLGEYVSKSSVLFGVTNDDIGALTEEEFDEVWAALGKVARARTRQRPEPSQDSTNEEDES